MKKNTLLLLLFLITGVVFRSILASYAPKELIWDSNTYHEFAMKMLSGQITADFWGKNLGYSAFLAIIYIFFGANNLLALQVIQIGIDVCTALLILKIASNKFGKFAGWISFLVYLFNPFTSAYTGLRLAETVTLFYLAVITYVVSHKEFSKKISLWILLGGFLGLTVFTRKSFSLFALFLILTQILRIPKIISKVTYLITTTAFFLIVMSYTIVSNVVNFGKATLIPPYGMGAAQLYMNFQTERHAELLSEYHPSPESLHDQITSEFQIVQYDYSKADEINGKYRKLMIERMKTDWPDYMKNVFQNIIWMWDKRILYPYIDPFFPSDTPILRFLDIGYLVAGFGSLLVYLWNKRMKAIHSSLFLFTIGTLFYNGILYGPLENETRHTIPFYGFLFLWSGYGIALLMRAFSHKKR